MYFAAFWIRGLAFLELEGIRAWCERGHCPEVLGESRSQKIFRLFKSKILQFLGNFLRGIQGEDGSSFPIHYTIVFSLVELALIGFQ